MRNLALHERSTRRCATCDGRPEPSDVQCLRCQLEGRPLRRRTLRAGAEAILARMDELGLSQADLVRAVGVANAAQVSWWCNARRGVPAGVRGRLAIALQWSDAELAAVLPRPARATQARGRCVCVCHRVEATA
jgi:hypothetical protein